MARCPNCGCRDVDVQVFQENYGGGSYTNTSYTEVRHGCLWWLLIGWWWKIIDLMLWYVLFIPRLIWRLAFPKKHKYRAQSYTTEVNDFGYRTIFVCKDCGYTWDNSYD